ncbi:hypothetical protein JCM3770_006645 [Rhodotorula araucariae]
MLSRSPPSSSTKSPAVARPPPAPEYLLRGHDAPVSVLCFSRCARFLFSGDTDGYVAVWHLRVFRPQYFWRAHEGGILGIAELADGLLTQGRDNLVHLYSMPTHAAAARTVNRGAAAAVPSPSAPSEGVERVWSLDINAMNFCRMSVCGLGVPGDDKGKAREVQGAKEALVAVPSLLKDDVVDIFHYPSRTRVHRSVGAGAFVGQKTGSVMALHLFSLAHAIGAPSQPAGPPALPRALHLLIAYESGQLALFRFAPTRSFVSAPVNTRSLSLTGAPLHVPREGTHIDESEGWELVWVEKGHRDAIMSLAVTPNYRFAYTAGADHHLVAYRIFDANDTEAARPRLHTELTSAAGHAGVAVRDDGRVLATAGWDGSARVYKASTLAPLAVLSHHRASLQAIAFAPLLTRAPPAASPLGTAECSDSDDDDDDVRGGGVPRAWLATGGQEVKIALCEVYPPRAAKDAGRRSGVAGA